MPNSFVFLKKKKKKKKNHHLPHYFQKEEERKMDQIKIFQNHGFMDQIKIFQNTTRGIRPCLIHFQKNKRKKKGTTIIIFFKNKKIKSRFQDFQKSCIHF